LREAAHGLAVMVKPRRCSQIVYNLSVDLLSRAWYNIIEDKIKPQITQPSETGGKDRKMKSVTTYNGKVYEGSVWQGKINGIAVEDLTPITAKYIYTTDTYGTQVGVRVDGNWQALDIRPEDFPIANGEYALTEEEYHQLMAANSETEETINGTEITETAEERAARLAKAKEHDAIYNEGAEGYNPYR